MSSGHYGVGRSGEADLSLRQHHAKDTRGSRARKSVDRRGGGIQHLRLGEAPEIASGTKNRGLVAVDDVLQVLDGSIRAKQSSLT
jgi:hypothetical protein